MLSISTYFSIQYLLMLLPLTAAVYALLPQRGRRVALLAANYAFFLAVSGKLLVYLLFSTLSIHHMGLWLADSQSDCDRALAGAEREARRGIKTAYQRRQRLIVALAAALQIGILAALKYTAFFLGSVNAVLGALGLPAALDAPSFALPIGISFYSMQAVSYVVDVYRRKLPADRSLLRLALYMSFFPQLMEGPICRYSETAPQLYDAPPIRYENLLPGVQRILFGTAKKMIVADRLNVFIRAVFGAYESYDGFVIAVAAVCYTVQLYMEFSGTMDVALGSARLFGVKLPENFQRPFFSKSISEFWMRWHITLGAWFRDYIYYPLSLSKPLKRLASSARKRFGAYYGALPSGALALLCVWLCNGLWHGAGWNYVFFGLYHFTLILLGNVITPLAERLPIDRERLPFRLLRILRTCVLVCIGELFFRAEGLGAGLGMFARMFTHFSLDTLTNGTFFSLGMDAADYIIVGAFLLMMLVIGVMQEKGVSVRESLSRRPAVVTAAVCYALVMAVVIFGAYGQGYVAVDPIYAGF